MQRIFSFKALPNGTYGEAFAIGAARYDVNGNIFCAATMLFTMIEIFVVAWAVSIFS